MRPCSRSCSHGNSAKGPDWSCCDRPRIQLIGGGAHFGHQLSGMLSVLRAVLSRGRPMTTTVKRAATTLMSMILSLIGGPTNRVNRMSELQFALNLVAAVTVLIAVMLAIR